jgi:hypothetical protein
MGTDKHKYLGALWLDRVCGGTLLVLAAALARCRRHA